MFIRHAMSEIPPDPPSIPVLFDWEFTTSRVWSQITPSNPEHSNRLSPISCAPAVERNYRRNDIKKRISLCFEFEVSPLIIFPSHSVSPQTGKETLSNQPRREDSDRLLYIEGAYNFWIIREEQWHGLTIFRTHTILENRNPFTDTLFRIFCHFLTLTYLLNCWFKMISQWKRWRTVWKEDIQDWKISSHQFAFSYLMSRQCNNGHPDIQLRCNLLFRFHSSLFFLVASHPRQTQQHDQIHNFSFHFFHFSLFLDSLSIDSALTIVDFAFKHATTKFFLGRLADDHFRLKLGF
jgi:hypothetical protein